MCSSDLLWLNLHPLSSTSPGVFLSSGPAGAQLASPRSPLARSPAQSAQLRADCGHFWSRPLLPEPRGGGWGRGLDCQAKGRKAVQPCASPTPSLRGNLRQALAARGSPPERRESTWKTKKAADELKENQICSLPPDSGCHQGTETRPQEPGCGHPWQVALSLRIVGALSGPPVPPLIRATGTPPRSSPKG